MLLKLVALSTGDVLKREALASNLICSSSSDSCFRNLEDLPATLVDFSLLVDLDREDLVMAEGVKTEEEGNAELDEVDEEW